MMNPEVLKTAREMIGLFLSENIKTKKLTIYQIEQKTGLPGSQIKKVLNGDNYTIDTLFRLINALDLYIFFAEKEGHHLDFEHMNQAQDNADPKL